MMQLAVISDTRRPTLPEALSNGHGLGRSAHDIAHGLAERGHNVTLVAHPNSVFRKGDVHPYSAESLLPTLFDAHMRDFDAILDTSHSHRLSQARSRAPIVNRIADRECRYQPRNPVVNSDYMLGHYPGSRLIRTGIDASTMPYYREALPYFVFASSHHLHKGWPEVVDFAERAEVHLEVASALSGEEKWACIGKAAALLHPSTIDAAPRLPLEAAALGVPTICLRVDGARFHVINGVTGFVVGETSEEWEIAIGRVIEGELDRGLIRSWVTRTHDFDRMIAEYENALEEVANGGQW